jgi:hypothetical protein
MKRSFLAAVLVLGFSGSAFAQMEQRVIQEKDQVKYRENTHVDFIDVDVEGVRKGPDIGEIVGHRHVKFDNLIKVRKDFNPELQASVENL